MARDGDRSRLGPKSLGKAVRFVVDHAACPVLLVWPEPPPDVGTIPPPPPHHHHPGRGPGKDRWLAGGRGPGRARWLAGGWGAGRARVVSWRRGWPGAGDERRGRRAAEAASPSRLD
jgi:hypothetical protein